MAEKNIFEILDRIRKENWSTTDGLIYYSVGIFLLTSVAVFFLKELGVGNALRVVGIPVNVWWILTVIILIELLHFSLWKVKRSGFYTSEKLLLVFAIKAGKESDTYVKEIKKNIRRQLAMNGLSDTIDVDQLPPDVEFSSPQKAEKYAGDKNINFLLWGDTTEATRSGSKITVLNLNISYIFAALMPQQKAALMKDIGQALQKEPWGEIDQMNSITGIQIATENIFEISLFTLGVCLITSPNVAYHLKAINILEQLKKQLRSRRGDTTFPQAKFVLDKVNYLLLDNYVALSYYYVFVEHNYEKGIEFGEKALLIDQQNFGAHLNLANYYWKTGNEKLSRQHAKSASKIHPSSNLGRLNRAFFRFFDRNFAGGLRSYKKLSTLENAPVLAVCEFVEEEYEKHQDNLGLLFAFSWLSINFGDEGRGKERMKEFLSKASNDDEYTELVHEAQNILSKSS